MLAFTVDVEKVRLFISSSSFIPKLSNPSIPLSFNSITSSGLIAGAKCFSTLSNDVSVEFSVALDGDVGCGLGLSFSIGIFSFSLRGVIVDLFLWITFGKLDSYLKIGKIVVLIKL